ncbi:MAG: hypothetical protein HUJ68_05765 [Clostridia bacterium]|nr:hypothetical protein [Clostridia bacterium]
MNKYSKNKSSRSLPTPPIEIIDSNYIQLNTYDEKTLAPNSPVIFDCKLTFNSVGDSITIDDYGPGIVFKKPGVYLVNSTLTWGRIDENNFYNFELSNILDDVAIPGSEQIFHFSHAPNNVEFKKITTSCCVLVNVDIYSEVHLQLVNRSTSSVKTYTATLTAIQL